LNTAEKKKKNLLKQP